MTTLDKCLKLVDDPLTINFSVRLRSPILFRLSSLVRVDGARLHCQIAGFSETLEDIKMQRKMEFI